MKYQQVISMSTRHNIWANMLYCYYYFFYHDIFCPSNPMALGVEIKYWHRFGSDLQIISIIINTDFHRWQLPFVNINSKNIKANFKAMQLISNFETCMSVVIDGDNRSFKMFSFNPKDSDIIFVEAFYPICTGGAQVCAPLWKFTRCMSNFAARPLRFTDF